MSGFEQAAPLAARPWLGTVLGPAERRGAGRRSVRPVPCSATGLDCSTLTRPPPQSSENGARPRGCAPLPDHRRGS